MLIHRWHLTLRSGTRYDILSLSDCDAAMYPANAWALQAPSDQLVSVPLGGEPLAAHGGCGDGVPIAASHYGSGFVRLRRSDLAGSI